ncbi:MAG: mannose-1-phosphate guanylyltransferase [Calditrichaeota bacterium]|nr:MAG: mannose-1-phosphate guanylyltransferase [Calditrichota bacterium]
MAIYAVLMAGGVGTRFWPRSRESYPKQVLNILDDETMIQKTRGRLKGLVSDENIRIVTTAQQKSIIQQQLPTIAENNYILEPMGKNTAPCIGLAALHLLVEDPEAVMVVLPADHLISNTSEFREVIRIAVSFVQENGGLVTLGITPTEPATGYGYIQAGEVVSETKGHKIHRVKTFAEKPNLETAQRFLQSGDFYWNSGMFIWKASTILDEIGEKLPDLHERLWSLQKYIGSNRYEQKLTEVYQSIRNISIDVGVMQEASEVYVIPSEMGWSDVGSWATVYQISKKDKNLHAGEYEELVSIHSKECYVYSPDKLVALVGVKDLVIVDTGDALLICKKSEAQLVKETVDELKRRGLTRWT